MNRKRYFKYFLFYLFTIISSICAVIIYLYYFPVNSKIITKNKTIPSGPIVIESQFKKAPTVYNDEEKKQRADRLKNRLDRAKMRRKIEQENKAKINLDSNIKKKAEEMENKISFEKPK